MSLTAIGSTSIGVTRRSGPTSAAAREMRFTADH
jgi:hypothetical protein